MRRPLRVESEADVCGGSAFFGKRSTHLLQNAAWSRVPKTIRVDDLSIVDRNAQLAEPASHRFDFNSILFFQLCRHPGGNRLLRESERTTANNDFMCHFPSPIFHLSFLSPPTISDYPTLNKMTNEKWQMTDGKQFPSLSQRHGLSTLHVRVFEQHHPDEGEWRAANGVRKIEHIEHGEQRY